MRTSNNNGGLHQNAVNWYANRLGVIALAGAVVFVLLALRIGPPEVVAVVGLNIAVAFCTVLFTLYRGSDSLYKLFNDD